MRFPYAAVACLVAFLAVVVRANDFVAATTASPPASSSLFVAATSAASLALPPPDFCATVDLRVKFAVCYPGEQESPLHPLARESCATVRLLRLPWQSSASTSALAQLLLRNVLNVPVALSEAPRTASALTQLSRGEAHFLPETWISQRPVADAARPDMQVRHISPLGAAGRAALAIPATSLSALAAAAGGGATSLNVSADSAAVLRGMKNPQFLATLPIVSPSERLAHARARDAELCAAWNASASAPCNGGEEARVRGSTPIQATHAVFMAHPSWALSVAVCDPVSGLIARDGLNLTCTYARSEAAFAAEVESRMSASAPVLFHSYTPGPFNFSLPVVHLQLPWAANVPGVTATEPLITTSWMDAPSQLHGGVTSLLAAVNASTEDISLLARRAVRLRDGASTSVNITSNATAEDVAACEFATAQLATIQAWMDKLPIVTDADPRELSATGGEVLIVTGENFAGGQYSGVEISIGFTRCTRSMWISSSRLECITPPGTQTIQRLSVRIGAQSAVSNVFVGYQRPMLTSVDRVETVRLQLSKYNVLRDEWIRVCGQGFGEDDSTLMCRVGTELSAAVRSGDCALCLIPVDLPFGTSQLAVSADAGRTWSSGLSVLVGDGSFLDASKTLPWNPIPSGVASAYFPETATIVIILPSGAATGSNERGDSTRAGVEVGVARAKEKLGILPQTNVNVVVYDDRQVFAASTEQERIKRLIAMLSTIVQNHKLIVAVFSSFSSRSLLLQHPEVLSFWRDLGCVAGRCVSTSALSITSAPLHMSDKGTNVLLSSQTNFPVFRRVAPPDAAQARGLIAAVNQVADALKSTGVYATIKFETAVIVEEGSTYSRLLYEDVIKEAPEFGIEVKGYFLPSSASLSTPAEVEGAVNATFSEALGEGYRAFIVVTEAQLGIAWGQALAKRPDRSSIYVIVSDFTSGRLPVTFGLEGLSSIDVGFDRTHPELAALEARVASLAVPDSVPQAVDAATLICYAFDLWLKESDWRESAIFQMSGHAGDVPSSRVPADRAWVPFSALAPYLDTADLSDITKAFELANPLALTTFTQFDGNDPATFSYLIYNMQPADQSQVARSVTNTTTLLVREAATFASGGVQTTLLPGARLWLPAGQWFEVTAPRSLEIGVVLPIPDLYDSNWQLVGLEAAVRDVNNNRKILANTHLKLRVYGVDMTETGAGKTSAVTESVSFIESLGRRFSSGLPLADGSVLAVFGCALSTLTVPCARAAAKYTMPILSASATANELADPKEFPFFLRTTTANDRLAEAMLRFVVDFEWPRACMLFVTDDTYSVDLANVLQRTADVLPVELSPVVGLASTATDSEILAALTTIKGARGRVILLPVLELFGSQVLRLACGMDMCGPEYIWVGGDSMSSEIWNRQDGSTDEVLLRASQRLFGVSIAAPPSSQRRTAEASIMATGSSDPDPSMVEFSQPAVENGTRLFRASIRAARLRECGRVALYDRSASGFGTNVSKCVSFTAAGATHSTILEYAAYDTVQLLAQTVDGLYGNKQAVRPYTLAFQSALRSFQFSGASGPLRFTTASNDRLSMQFAQRVVEGRNLKVLGLVSELGRVLTVPCPAGYGFDAVLGGCSECPENTYKSAVANSPCTPCPEVGDSLSTTTNGKTAATSITECLCPVSTYRPPTAEAGTVQCNICPEGGRCASRGLSLADVEALPGFWRGHPNSTRFATCTSQQRCPGGPVLPTSLAPSIDDKWYGGVDASYWWRFSTQCEPGYMGPRCTQCSSGFAKGSPFTGVEASILSQYASDTTAPRPLLDSSSLACNRCPSRVIRGLIVLAGIAGAALVLAVMIGQHASLSVPSAERLRRMSNTRVLMTFLQSTGMLLPVAPWSPLVAAVFESSQSVGSLGPSLLALDCYFDADVPHMTQYLWPAVGFPMSVVLFAFVLYCFSRGIGACCRGIRSSAKFRYRTDLLACAAAFAMFLFYPTVIESLLRSLECRAELSMVAATATCATHTAVSSCGFAATPGTAGQNTSTRVATERWMVSSWTQEGGSAGSTVAPSRMLYSDARISCEGQEFERIRLAAIILITCLVLLLPACICIFARRYQRLLQRGGPEDTDPALAQVFGRRWKRRRGMTDMKDGELAMKLARGTANAKHRAQDAISAQTRHDGLPLVVSHSDVQTAVHSLKTALKLLRSSVIAPHRASSLRVRWQSSDGHLHESELHASGVTVASSAYSSDNAKADGVPEKPSTASLFEKDQLRTKSSCVLDEKSSEPMSLDTSSKFDAIPPSLAPSDGGAAEMHLPTEPIASTGAPWDVGTPNEDVIVRQETDTELRGATNGFLGGNRKRSRRRSIVKSVISPREPRRAKSTDSGDGNVETHAVDVPSKSFLVGVSGSVAKWGSDPIKTALVREMGRRERDMRRLTAEVFKDTMFQALCHTPSLRNTERLARFFHRQALAYMVDIADEEGRVPSLEESAYAALEEMRILSSTQLKLGMVMLPYKTQYAAYEIAITLRKIALTFASVVLINSHDFVWRVLVSIAAILIAHRLTISLRPFRMPFDWTRQAPSTDSILVVRRGDRRFCGSCCAGRQSRGAKVVPKSSPRGARSKEPQEAGLSVGGLTSRAARSSVAKSVRSASVRSGGSRSTGWRRRHARSWWAETRAALTVQWLLLPWRWSTLRLEEMSLQVMQVNLLAALVANVANSDALGPGTQSTVGDWATSALEWTQVFVTLGLIGLMVLAILADTVVATGLLRLDWSTRRAARRALRRRLSIKHDDMDLSSESEDEPVNTRRARAVLRSKLALIVIGKTKRNLVLRALEDGDCGVL